MTQLCAVLLLSGGVTENADAFLKSLAPARREQALLKFDDAARTRWHYTAGVRRPGVPLRAMTPPERARAHELLKALLSERGYEQVAALMKLEPAIGDDPLAYHVAVFGAPRAERTWAVKVEGHHLSINVTVRDGKPVSWTPMFLGANPARTRDGARLLAREEDLGFALLASLDARQRARAVVSERTAGDMNEADRAQAPATPPVGLAGAAMSPGQRERLVALVRQYVARLPDTDAEAVLGRLEGTRLHFAWYGGQHPGDRHSYRIQGPDLLILYFHARFNHAHCVWRTNGHDFGA